MALRAENQIVRIAGEDAVGVLRELELVVVSLHRIGSYYATNSAMDRSGYEHETTRFIDEWKVTERLANARAVLSKYFDSTMGADDMDDLEREMESVEYWDGPGSEPPHV